MSDQVVIGIDLGGTNVRGALIDQEGRVLGERLETPSHAQEGTLAILKSMTELVTELKSQATSQVKAMGLSVPGHIDNDGGLVKWAPNFGEMVEGVFRYWVDVPLRDQLESMTSLKVVMGNDANCAALGEYRFGTGENCASCLVLLTLGTGIGGGVVLSPRSVDGKAQGPLLLLGGNKGGVELGHVVISKGGMDCNAGSYGAIEAYCQRDSIIRRAQHKLRRGRESVLNTLYEGNISKISPKDLSEAADRGDEVAREVWKEVGEYLGVGIGNFINIFAPDVLAIGGQISKSGAWLIEPAIREAKNVAIPSLFADCKIKLAQQIDDAGILGAAALAWQSI